MTAAPPLSRSIATNGVELSVVEAGSGPLVVLCHGFPELAYSWRHQIPVLAEAGYHVVAPDQRGYGRSSRPEAIGDYDIEHLTGDLLGLLDALGEEKAVFVGHDWGANVVWWLALTHPDRVAGVVGMSVPFVPRSKFKPTRAFKMLFSNQFFYMDYFQEPGVADADLDGDPQTFLRGMFAGTNLEGPVTKLSDLFSPKDGRGMVERLPQPETLPAWLPQADLDHYVEEFTRTGFTGGINWYRNLDRNWELAEAWTEAHVTVPALYVAGANDPVVVMTPPTMMKGWVDDLRDKLVIEGAGHWIQQERPDEVNEALLDFLKSLDLGAA